MTKLLFKLIVFPAVIIALFGVPKALAGAAAASVFEMAQQYRPEKLRNAIKDESAGTPLSAEETTLLTNYHADEKEYKELKQKTQCVCSDNGAATSYKYAEDPLPDCKNIPEAQLKEAQYVDANGSHFLTPRDVRAKMEDQMSALNRKWAEGGN